MANQGEGPKCGKRVLHVNVETVIGMLAIGCMRYSCIHCNSVLGVQVDHRTKPVSRPQTLAKA